MSEHTLKMRRSLAAWQHSVERLTNTVFASYEREKLTPRDSGRDAYAFVLHELSDVLRHAGRPHNEALAAIKAMEATP